ncbi:hypothetical protein SAY86_020216 [Trapa natans]|uniref:Uncharacterized protein n=1 Tax=Trapa natans TaxID=22666 RepID=A0AAN7R3Z9_TRANT|nr:hypothetical protein SAY86_020216 [Trapa natans]
MFVSRYCHDISTFILHQVLKLSFFSFNRKFWLCYVSISVNVLFISVMQIPQHLSGFYNDAVGEKTCCSLSLMSWLTSVFCPLWYSFLESDCFLPAIVVQNFKYMDHYNQ